MEDKFGNAMEVESEEALQNYKQDIETIKQTVELEIVEDNTELADEDLPDNLRDEVRIFRYALMISKVVLNKNTSKSR